MERQGLVLIWYRERYLGIAKETKRILGFLENDSEMLQITLGKFPVAKGTFRKSF